MAAGKNRRALTGRFRIRRLLSALCWLLFSSGLTAQTRLQIEYTALRAPIWNHTPRLTIQTGVPRWSQEIALRWQTLGARDWQAWQRYPAWGVAIQHVELGAQAHGRALAILSLLDVRFLQRPRWSLQFRTACGLAWLQHPYHSFRNPGQNALSTHLNIATQFRLGAQARLSPTLQAAVGGVFTHYSNGGVSLPNFGINMPGFFLSVQGNLQPLRPEHFRPAATSPRTTGDRWGVQAQTGFTLAEYNAYDGPRYAIWMGSAAAVYALRRTNRLLLGIDYEYNQAVYAWGLHSTLFRDEQEARLGASRLAVYVADEFRFGALGIQVHTGFYTGRERLNRQTLTPVFNKVNVYRYFTLHAGAGVRAFAGISLKAHKNIAEYIAVTAGMEIGGTGEKRPRE